MQEVDERTSEGVMLPLRNGTPFKHITVRSYDPESGVFYLQSESGESRVGMCFQGNPITGADASSSERLKSVLTNSLPAGSFVQFGLFSEPDVKHDVATYMSSKEKAKGLLKRLSQKRAEFITGGATKPLSGMNEIHLCRQRIIFSVSIKCAGTMVTPKEIKEVSDIAIKLTEGFTSLGLWLSKMDDAQYMALLRRFGHLYEDDDYIVDEFAPLREQVFAPAASVEFNTDEVSFNDGEYFSRTLSIKHFPKVASLGLMNMLVGDQMGGSNQLTEPFWMTATLHYPDQDKKIADVRMRHAWITNQSFGGLAHLIPVLRYKKQGIDTLLHELDGGGGMLCELNFTVMLFSRSQDRLSGLVSSYKAWANSKGFDIREDKRILKPLFYNLLPLGTTVNGIQNLYRFHTMAITHAIRMLPIIGNWKGTGSGGATIMTTRRGTTALFDPYDSPTNQNGIIIAGSGSGKSFAGQRFLVDWMAGDARAWVIDQGRNFEKLCRALDGQFIEFSEDSDICLNPFSQIEEIDEHMDILTAMFTKMAAPEHGLDEYRLAALAEKIKGAYSDRGQEADADLVAKHCLNDPDLRIKDIGKMLFNFTRHGPYGHWFNGKNNVDFTKDFVCIELKELENKKTLQQVVLIQLFANIGNAMYHTHGRKKALLIDEAWSLLQDPVMGKAIEIAYRTVRKHLGSAWLITQNINDVYDSPSGRAIISSSEYQIIMRQKAEAVDDAIRSEHLKMNMYEIMMLKSVHTVPGRYAEMMIRCGENWGITKLVEDRFAQILFSTKGWERDEVMQRMRNGEDVIDVIDQYVKEGRE